MAGSRAGSPWTISDLNNNDNNTGKLTNLSDDNHDPSRPAGSINMTQKGWPVMATDLNEGNMTRLTTIVTDLNNYHDELNGNAAGMAALLTTSAQQNYDSRAHDLRYGK